MRTEACLKRTTHTISVAGIDFVVSGTGAARGGTLRDMYGDLAPIALDIADRLSTAVDSADRAAFERAVDRLIERSAKLAAEFAKGKATG